MQLLEGVVKVGVLKFVKMVFDLQQPLILTRALMSLNEFQPENETPLIQIVVMSRNSPETGIRVFHNIREQKLDITRSA